MSFDLSVGIRRGDRITAAGIAIFLVAVAALIVKSYSPVWRCQREAPLAVIVGDQEFHCHGWGRDGDAVILVGCCYPHRNLPPGMGGELGDMRIEGARDVIIREK